MTTQGKDSTSEATKSVVPAVFTTAQTLKANAAQKDARKPVNSLPFVIEKIMLNDEFVDKHRLVRIEAGVTGGNRMQWAATSVAIAEIVSRSGVDSIEVLLYRSEIPINKSKMYRELAQLYYTPNPKFSIWGASKEKWKIYVAQEKI